jgi:TolA-binding protein
MGAKTRLDQAPGSPPAGKLVQHGAPATRSVRLGRAGIFMPGKKQLLRLASHPGAETIAPARDNGKVAIGMSAPEVAACLQACPNCAALVDVCEQEPLAKFHCPICGTAMRAARQFNHFSIVEHLGSGGMGSVYKALDRNLNRLVALKLLKKEMSADETYIGKLEDEARITASINHPFVVKVFSFGSDCGQYYIAMELVDKGSLDDLMNLQTRVAELQVMQVGLQVASGLQAAHERGLIHRDVKPGNILFADAHTAKITDFGLALLAEQEAESRGEIWGTPYYIAPEKLNNQPEDFRSDIYSLGATLFHAVAGRPPFEAESASLVALKHLKSRAVSLQAFAPDVSGETAYVINRMLHKDPNQRYNSYGELLDHLRYAIDTLQTKSGQPRAARQRVVVESAQQSNVAGILTLVMLILLLAGGVLAFAFRNRIFGNPEPAAASAAANAGATPDNSVAAGALYEEARRQIVEGQYATAQESLAALLRNGNPGQPLANWVRLHEGMAALLDHEGSDARAAFLPLVKSGAYSAAPDQKKLANFFPEAGRYLSRPDNIEAGSVNNWDKDTFADIALFLFGLKDWEAGDFDDAAKLFHAYLAGKPPRPYQWMTDYQPIARVFEHDYQLYAPLNEKLTHGAVNPAALLAGFAQARAQLQTTGKIVEAFDTAQTKLNSATAKAAAAAAAAATPAPAGDAGTVAAQAATPANTAVHAAEAARWQMFIRSFENLAAQYKYDQALRVLEPAQAFSPATELPIEPEFVQAREALKARGQVLVAFKNLLIRDINTRGGYPQPVTTLADVAYAQGFSAANQDAFQAVTPYGTIAVPWTSLNPETILNIARYFAAATTDPRQAGGREWAAAVFALETGHAQEARALANLAVHNVPAYESQLAQFSGVSH